MTVTADVSPGQTSSATGTVTVRVLIVDDHDMVGQGLASVIADEADMEVVGVATTVVAAIAAAIALRPDVVVMDYRLGEGNGVDATRQLREVLPEVNIIMLTAFSDDSVLAAALEAGCCGFVDKASSVEGLLSTLRAAAGGGGVFAPEVVARLVRLRQPSPQGPRLSAREQEVLEMVADGQSTGGIALSLGLSQHTVRNHVRNFLSKLGAHSKLEAVVVAASAGLIQPPGGS